VDRLNTIEINTPEGIVFSLLPAGPVSRFLAWIIDLACIMVIMKVSFIILGLFMLISRDIATGVYIAMYFIVSIGYGICLEWYYKGKTLGKHIMHLRVMDEQGLNLHFSQIVIRNLLRFIDSLPAYYMVGGISSVITRKNQRLGDLAANTIVIRHPKIQEPDLEQIRQDKYNSLRNYPHLCARLRQRTSLHEADIALQAILRRSELEPAARIELFSEIASHFKSIVTFPQEATDGITDEQYTRNIVDILFSQQIGPEKKTGIR